MGSYSRSVEHFQLNGGGGAIEVILHKPDGIKPAAGGVVAVVCHPHPLYGGTMDNKVVNTVARCYWEQGVAVARFNFRGVGASEGIHDNGVGEVADLMVVVNWLRDLYGADRILLAGFSFGSAIVAAGSHLIGDVSHLLLVAPPVDRYVYEQSGQFLCPVCVVMGERDELVDMEGVYRWLATVRSPVELVRMPEATHFFHGFLVKMKQELSPILTKILTD